MVIYRSCATGLYQVVWHRQPSRLVVQRYGPSSLYLLVNNLHFQRGYDQEGLAYQTWVTVWKPPAFIASQLPLAIC